MSIFPVGFIAKIPVSTLILSKSGTFIRFFDGWVAGRKFPVDMAGFAVNIEFSLRSSWSQHYHLSMVIGNRKEEGRLCLSSIHRSLEKAQRPARIELVTNSEPEKAKLVPGFEPGLLGQNTTALPLAPHPRPCTTTCPPIRHFKTLAYLVICTWQCLTPRFQ